MNPASGPNLTVEGRSKPLVNCWGVGLARTGTSSLAIALGLLGYERVGHNPPFEQMRELQAASDNSIALYYKYLDFRFPGSKFLLTTRNLSDWLESMKWLLDRFPIARDDDVAIARRMGLYETTVYDRERLEFAYHRHHTDVRRYFADRPDDLIEMSIVEGQGWEVLCPHLGLEVPDAPFPNINPRR